MIPNTKDRTIAASGVVASGEFGISLADSAHLMTILRDTLYSDKILAVLREYSSNAWDAHRDAGKHDLPIKVILPTVETPSLTIRDYGKGLSREDVFKVYTQYGASTKRNSDDSVGMLGIGCKSGFAYSDSFTVTSFHGGMKRTYVAVLDTSEKGIISLLHESESDETGVEIQIPVAHKDIWEFKNKAQKLFKYFNPRPNINIPLPVLPTAEISSKYGVIYDVPANPDGYDEQAHFWVAVMGCVPYRIDLDQLKDRENPENGIPSYLPAISGALYFNIGEVQVNASREELKYTDSTKKALIEKFKTLVETYVTETLATIEAGTGSSWEKRVQAQILHRLKLPVPFSHKDLTAMSVKLGPYTGSFIIHHGQPPATALSISQNNRLVFRDDSRSLKGFDLDNADYVVRKVGKVKWDKVEEEVTERLKSLKLEGIPFVFTSKLPWSTPLRKANGKVFNPKHHLKSFKFNPKRSHSHPFSTRWEPETKRTPLPEDVFVILKDFEAFDPAELMKFYDWWGQDCVVLEHFGLKMPDVYGYKTTKKHPLEIKDCVGVHYSEWRKKTLQSLLTPDVFAQIDEWGWRNLEITHRYYYDSRNLTPIGILREVSSTLGKKHAITDLVKNWYREQVKKKRTSMPEALRLLRDFIDPKVWRPAGEILKEEIEKKYPLFSLHQNDLYELWGKNGDMWVQYVKALDKP